MGLFTFLSFALVFSFLISSKVFGQSHWDSFRQGLQRPTMETFSRGGVKSRIIETQCLFLSPLWVFEKEGLMERRKEFVFAPPPLYSSSPSLFPEVKLWRPQKSFSPSTAKMICIWIKMMIAYCARFITDSISISIWSDGKAHQFSVQEIVLRVFWTILSGRE